MKNSREEIKLTRRTDTEKSMGILKCVCSQSLLYTESSFDFIFFNEDKADSSLFKHIILSVLRFFPYEAWGIGN